MQKERARGNRQGKEEEQSVYSVKGITTSLGLGNLKMTSTKLLALRRATTSCYATSSSVIFYRRKCDDGAMPRKRFVCASSSSSNESPSSSEEAPRANGGDRAYTPKKVWGPPLEVSKTLNRRPTVLEWRGPNFPQDQSDGLVFLVDKPQEWTSFDVCAKIKSMSKKMGVKKIGHCGTLDPMATGLLIVVIGRATKLADEYQAKVKTYTGTIKLGEKTASGDADNEVIETKPFGEDIVNEASMEAARASLIGDIEQIPPMFSAVHVDGKRLYESAREGKTVERKPRPVHVGAFSIKRRETENETHLIDFEVTCSKGTYVRTLAEDFCEKMGTVGHLVKLRREKIGDFDVKDAFELPALLDEISITVSEHQNQKNSY